MAILKDLIVSGSSRLLGKLYTNDIEIGGEINAEGGLHVGKNTAANANIYLNNKLAMRGVDGYLRINENSAFTSGVYFGSSAVWTKGNLYIGDGTTKSTINNSSATFPVPVTFSYTANAGGNVGLKVNGTATIATGNITTANTNTINNADMITTSALDVKGKLHAVEYDLENIMDLGGSFVVAPTLIVPSSGSGTKTLTVTKSNNTTVVMTVRDPSITSGGIAGFAWANNYKVKVSGLVNNTVLGTCDGYINTTNVGSNTISLTVTMDAETVTAIATTVTTYKLNIMLYNTDTSSATAVTKPLGIYLQHYELTNNPIINVWNGQTTTPKVRIGYLGGITYNGSSLGTNAQNSWGLYSDSVFLEGQIIANGGKIGGYSIGTANLTKGTTQNASGSFWLTPEGQSSVMSNLSSSAQTWAMTVGQNFGVTTAGAMYTQSGYIATWKIESNDLVTGTWGSDNSAMLCTGTSSSKSIGGSSSINGWVFTAGSKFGVTKTGALYCNDIHAGGGDIAGWRIESSYLASGTATGPAANVLLLSPNGTSSSYTIAGQAKTGWMITAGTTFGVNKDGGVYATGGKIGGFNITTNAIYSTTNALGTTANNVYVGTEGISLGTTFKVTKEGVLNATDATITGGITAESFSALDSNSKERATVNTNGFIVKDASGNTVATLSNDLTIGQVVANRYNVFIDADVGIQNRKNTSVLSQFDSTSIKFYDGSGTAAANITAQFLSTGATIGKTSTNHVLLDSSGMKVKNGGTVLADFGSTITLGQTTGQAAVINSDGMQIYKGGNKVADFGENIRIGKENSSSATISPDLFMIKNAENIDLFSVDSDGGETNMAVSQTITTNIESDENSNTVTVYPSVMSTLVPNNSEVNVYFSYEYVSSSFEIITINANWNIVKGTSYSDNSDNNVSIVYNGADKLVFTIKTGALVITNSAKIKIESTINSKGPSFTLGTRSGIEKGAFSTVIGQGLIGDGSNQLVIGSYNSSDPSKSFIIGNGSGDGSLRKNALTVDAYGNLKCNNIGAVYSNTRDRKITEVGIDTFAVGASIELEAGVYVITGTWVFGTGVSSGTRNMEVRLTNGSGTVIGTARQRILAAANNYAVLQATFVGALDAGTYQVEGSCSMRINAEERTEIRAVRIA